MDDLIAVGDFLRDFVLMFSDTVWSLRTDKEDGFFARAWGAFAVTALGVERTFFFFLF